MRAPISTLATFAFAVFQCASAPGCVDGAHALTPVPPLTTAEPGSIAAAAPAAVAERAPVPVVTTPSTEPTVLSSEDQQRDATLADKIAHVVDAYSNVGARLTHDGKRVVFRSNRKGVWQLFASDVAAPGAPPTQLTSSAERVVDFEITPDDKSILYLSDEGADENFGIFKIGIDGGAPVSLTPGDKLRRTHPFVPRANGNIMVYAGAPYAQRAQNIYVQSLDGAGAGGAPKLVKQDPFPGIITSITADGSQALYLRIVNTSERVLFHVDLATGQSTRLHPEDGKKAAIGDAVFSADGKRIFVATDDGTESAFVLALEANVKSPTPQVTVKARYKEERPATAHIERIVATNVGDKLAITVDAGNKTDVRFLDAKTLAPLRNVTTPLGTALAGEATEDGKSVTITLSTPDRPADILLADVATGLAKPLRDEKRDIAGMPPIDSEIVKVPAHDGLSVPVNTYLPKTRARTDRLPVIVAVHGGPASSYRVRWNETTRWFTSQGFAVVEPNVRGSTGFGRAYELADNREKRPDAFKDLEAVNKWVRAQKWADPDRVVVYGGSYGGYMVLIALTRQPTLWAAGVDLFGVSSLPSLFRTTSGFIRSILTDEFGDPERDAALLESLSPIKDVDKITAPLFVYAGANDPRVPKSESDAIVAAMRSRKLPVEYQVASNEGHSLDRRENRVAFMARVTRFLNDRVPAKK